MPQVKNALSTIVIFFVALFLYTKFAGPLPFSVTSVTTTKNNLFQATGVGQATAVPDTALLNLGVTKQAPTVTQAQLEVNSAIKTITQDLKNLGVEKKNIKTTNYSVSPVYNQGQAPNGYSVNATLEVKVSPIEKANQAIDSATKDGANMVSGATFVLDDQTQKDLEQKAREDAVKEAKQKAEGLAKAAGIHLGRIVDVQESSGGGPIRIQPLAASEKAPGEPTQLSPGENTVSVSVTISYETY